MLLPLSYILAQTVCLGWGGEIVSLMYSREIDIKETNGMGPRARTVARGQWAWYLTVCSWHPDLLKTAKQTREKQAVLSTWGQHYKYKGFCTVPGM